MFKNISELKLSNDHIVKNGQPILWDVNNSCQSTYNSNF